MDDEPLGGGPRGELAGKPLGWRAVVVMVKADWAEYASTMSFRTWQHHQHPCFLCFAKGGDGGDLQNFQGCSVRSLEWRAKDQDSYNAECAAHEVRVTIPSLHVLSDLVGRLHYDKKKAGYQGRVLMSDCTLLGLRKGCTLEPSFLSFDVGSIDARRDFPFDLWFWQHDKNSATRHRNPLFDEGTYITPSILVADEMHCMHLGVFSTFLGSCFWQCIEADVFSLGARGLPDSHVHEMSAQRIEADYKEWFSRATKADPDVPLYKLPDFKLEVLGPRSNPGFHAKAAQTGTAIRYIADFMKRYQGKVKGGEVLCALAACLEQYMIITRRSPKKVDFRTKQQLMNTMFRYLSLREAGGISWIPKLHLSLHMIDQSTEFGNPLNRGTWVDEGLNKCLRDVSASSHALVWHRRVLATMAHVLKQK